MMEETISKDLGVKKLSEIEEKKIEWLIPGYIPRGSISVIAGEDNYGEFNISDILCALAAAISTGRNALLVDSENQKKLIDSKQEQVLFLSGRDSIEDTLIRKLRKNDANLENVYAMDVTDKKFSKLKFTGVYLEQLLQKYHPALCIFDPVQDFLPTGVKMNVKNAVRNCIAPLVGLGEKYGTAFLIVVHTDNQRPIPGRKKISNSADIWNIGRSVLRVGETEEKNINYIAHEKSDYGQLCKTVLYRVEDERVVFEGYND